MAYKFLNEMGLSHIFTIVKNALKGKSDTNHTHLYAGSSSVGGSATSAEKLNSNAGSATQPIYFSGGVPVNTTHTLGASVPSGAKFTDTTYSAMTASEATEGTATTARSITAKVLNDKIDEVVKANAYSKTEVDTLISSLQTKITELENKLSQIPADGFATVATTGSYKDLTDLPTKLNEVKDY